MQKKKKIRKKRGITLPNGILPIFCPDDQVT